MCESDLHCVCASLCHSLKKITLNGVIEEKSKLAITVFLSFSFRNFFSHETFHLCHIFSCLVIPNNAAIRLLAGSWSCVRCNVWFGLKSSEAYLKISKDVLTHWSENNNRWYACGATLKSWIRQFEMKKFSFIPNLSWYDTISSGMKKIKTLLGDKVTCQQWLFICCQVWLIFKGVFREILSSLSRCAVQ